MKTTKFLWGWKEHALQPDPLMTRERAARLIRAWRRGAYALERVGKGHYKVTARGYETEPATMIVLINPLQTRRI